jgi:thioredoxin-related protein
MMKKVGLWSGLAVTLFLASPGFASIRWSPSFQAARAEAAATHRPILISFYTDWCGWCRKLDSDVYTSPQVIEMSRRFVMLKLNAEKEGAALAQHYGVKTYPNAVFLQPSGNGLGQLPGYLDPPAYVRLMQSALAGVEPRSRRREASTRVAAPKRQAPVRSVKSWKADDSSVLVMDADGVVEIKSPAAIRRDAQAAKAKAKARGKQRQTRRSATR